MARTINTIQAEIIASIAANADLTYVDEGGITRNLTYNTSRRSIWRAFTWVMAAAIAVFEQLQDVYLSAIETLVARSSAASQLWVQAKMFEFQYDAITPQIVQLINTIPQFPVIDLTKRIITACSVTKGIVNVINVKVAKSSPFVKLDTLEIAAAQSYITTIGDARTVYNVISLDADRLYIEADIYYIGQYSSVIQANVIAAINAYLQQLSVINFNGDLKMSDLESFIRSITGVTDVVLNNVRARAQTAVPDFNTGTDLILSTAVLQRLYNSSAGYVVQEDIAGKTFTDSLTFIPQ